MNKKFENTDAFIEGRRAAHEGKTLNDNPYSTAIARHRGPVNQQLLDQEFDWEEGFLSHGGH